MRRKHTIADYAHLWLSNWKYRRLLPVRLARSPFGRNLSWPDLPFVSFGAVLHVAGALWRGESIPGTVMLVGAPFTMRQWDQTCEWADKLISENPQWGILREPK